MSSVTYKDMVITVVGWRPSPDKPTKMTIRAGNFEIMTDKLGGEAPSPIEYLLASYAGCLNIVGNIIAGEMGIKIQDLRVEITGVFNPAKLLSNKGDRAGYKEIKVKVMVKSDADEETLIKWLSRVRERCPVEDNLANPTPIEYSVQRIE